MAKTALITGIAGQDGSYLAELLLAKGYRVHGLVRRRPGGDQERIEHLRLRLSLHEADWTDQRSLEQLLRKARPAEVYNLAGPSFVPDSWSAPAAAADLLAVGVIRLLEAIRAVDPTIRFYQASSSEMFGSADTAPQNENTPLRPRSPYAAAKVHAHWTTVNCRERYDLYACSGILFNHESPRRGVEFVTRKISRAAAQIKLGLNHEVRLGNLQSRRDWGYAADFVRAMWLMLQQDRPCDLVIGAGQAHSVEEFAAAAFRRVGLDWRDHVAVDPQFFRPAEATPLVADASKARALLGWRPQVGFDGLVAMMVDADLAALSGSGAGERPSRWRPAA